MQQTNFELMKAIMPTPQDKARVARRLGLSPSLMYKWCEDPETSGKVGPIDRLEVIVEYALVHHPDAAAAIIQKFDHTLLLRTRERSEATSLADLLLLLQPSSEREILEAVTAFSTALRQLLLGNSCDPHALLKEIQEAERAMRNAAVMLQTTIDDDRTDS